MFCYGVCPLQNRQEIYGRCEHILFGKRYQSRRERRISKFYKANRPRITRGPDGIEFPIIADRQEIRQGIGASIAYLYSGKKLDVFFSVGFLHGEWVDGIHISDGDPQYTDEFIAVLKLLKGKNMKLQLETFGKNSMVLQKILNEKLADVVVMNVLGPKSLYSNILGSPIDLQDVAASMNIVPQFPEYRFQTALIPVHRDSGEISYLTPEEIGETALFIKEATGSLKHKYLIKPVSSNDLKDEFKSVPPIADNLLLTYRTKARAYQVMSDIVK